MTTFHSQQSGDPRRTRKNANTGTFNITPQIAPSICTLMFTKRVKPDAMIFTSRRSHLSLISNFRHGQALPLVPTRFLRLANSSPKSARSPARRSRDGRETSGKKSGEISRVISAQRPGNGRTVAAAMPPSVRQDDSQDNLPCAGIRRAMSAPETCRQLATRLRNSRAAVCTMVIAKSHERLIEFSSSAFNHDIQRL
jgi:transposase-like protein